MQNLLWQKIEGLQKEIKVLKKLAKEQEKPAKKKVKKNGHMKSLYGILKGVKISEKDFQEAKKSLFPYDENLR
ncbi:hypothetical protein HYS94_01035 [Candidatus Daviesbacteria bacterium]|nr:hypothetical protein [Candidatus Daviesbacteria bacterium]